MGKKKKNHSFPHASLYPGALVQLIRSQKRPCWWRVSSNNYNSSYRADTEERVGVFKSSLGSASLWKMVDLRLNLMQVNCVLTGGESLARVSEGKRLVTGKQQPQLNYPQDYFTQGRVAKALPKSTDGEI